LVSVGFGLKNTKSVKIIKQRVYKIEREWEGEKEKKLICISNGCSVGFGDQEIEFYRLASVRMQLFMAGFSKFLTRDPPDQMLQCIIGFESGCGFVLNIILCIYHFY
jgi:hypothetical protein